MDSQTFDIINLICNILMLFGGGIVALVIFFLLYGLNTTIQKLNVTMDKMINLLVFLGRRENVSPPDLP
jgi:hypothetical protein